MKYLLTGTQMKEADRYSIEMMGIPSMVLMERAALACAERICETFSKKTTVAIAAGSGNNGADGLALARILSLRGYSCRVVTIGESGKTTEEWKHQRKILKNLNIPCFSWTKEHETACATLNASEVIADGIFGVGLSRSVEGAYRELVDFINGTKARGSWILAIDIASGVHSRTGEVLAAAVEADETVTFGWGKCGMVLGEGALHSGTVTVADIGFAPPWKNEAPAEFLGEPVCVTYSRDDLCRIPPRRVDGNKGTFGRVLIIAGSYGMCGAAYLSALSAYRSGCGLVEILTEESNRIPLQTSLPEAVISVWKKDAIREEEVKQSIARADAIVIGPGISTSEDAKLLLGIVMKDALVPTIVDADALNLISGMEAASFSAPVIFTPHMKELSRLLKYPVSELKKDLVSAAKELSKRYHCVSVCKDFRTVVSAPGDVVLINTSGTDGMAEGGSGDVLTGILASLTAQGCSLAEAARLGVYLHGLAGAHAAGIHGNYGMLAHDTANGVGYVMRKKETNEKSEI